MERKTNEKPILFSGEMVRAVLDGRKTQTRRVMKPQPEPCHGGWMFDGLYFADDDQMRSHLFHDVYGGKGSPYGSVFADGTAGRLWVRETWSQHTIDGHTMTFYRADCGSDGAPWKPYIFMPRGLSRIDLQLVDVRIERLQEISTADAIAEGIKRNWLGDDCPPEYENEWENYLALTDDEPPCYSAVDSFRALWDSINHKRGYGWQVNPWLWVVEFKRV